MRINPRWEIHDKEMFPNSEGKEHISNVTPKKLPKLEGFRGFVEAMVEDIILDDKPLDSYNEELKSQCKVEGVDYENLVYDLEDFIEELSIGLGSGDGLAVAMGIGFAMMDAEKYYIRREKIEEICNLWEQRHPNRMIHPHNAIDLGTNDNNR